mmetsp:Transcript_1065/g.1759  ORF Transcript_1065/g.1759 Transcript_1065/m.1759 type:complete len:95 (-) Transcript_1065:203-487(-)
MSALFDFSSLLVVILLFICAATFTRSLYPTIFNDKPPANNSDDPNNFYAGGGGSGKSHDGLTGLCWKASRVGERLSPYVAGACAVMAFQILFLK